MSTTAREVRARGSEPAGGEAASLVESAMLLRWRAPELALLLAERAASAAQDDPVAILRADHLAVFTLNRLGRHAEAAHRLFPAVHDADTLQGLRHELHVELAHCAVALGESATALGAVHPVLAAGDDIAPALRAGALVAVAEAAAALGCDDLVTSALEEADELYREDPGLDHDTALLLRAAARVTDAVRHRARGATDEAEAKVRDGRALLAGLADPDHDSGEVSARLMLELALLLLDRGAGEAAVHEVRPLLRRPVRAAAAAAVGRLRLAVATRVHLAEGRHEPALTLLADAVEGAQRYGMDAVLAECLEALSHVHEARDEFADALHCMRAARAAEARHLHEVALARSTLLEHCGTARREEARLLGEIAGLLGNAGTGSAGTEADVTEPATAVAGIPGITETDAVAADIVVDVAEAVGPEAEDQPAEASPDEERVREAESCQPAARHRRGSASTLVSVSDLLPASALSAGRPGRRRAEESAAESASGPPPAPEPRTLEWAPDDENSPQDGETSQMGLGDLLAEALAAYQESRDAPPDAVPTKAAAEADTGRSGSGYRGLGTRWMATLALAPHLDDSSSSDPSSTDSDADPEDAAEVIINPLLRLPELTAEPRWAPPDAGRRPAAGD